MQNASVKVNAVKRESYPTCPTCGIYSLVLQSERDVNQCGYCQSDKGKADAKG